MCHSMPLDGVGWWAEGRVDGGRLSFSRVATTSYALFGVTRHLWLNSDFLPVWVSLEGVWVSVCLSS